MTTSAEPIKPSDKLQSLFDRDERLIDMIASRSPQLAKLRNSPMRRIMARVTTVQQVARLCAVPLDVLLRDLNGVLGISVDSAESSAKDAPEIERGDQVALPDFSSQVELDVREDLARGGEPFSRIMSAVGALGDGEVLHLRAPFEPVPLFAVMAKRGFGHRVERHADDDWSVWFFRQDGASAEEPASKAASKAASEPASKAAPNHSKPIADVTPARPEVRLDVRNLEPPEPMVHTLEALESLPSGSVLLQINSRVPQFLLPILRERGFHFTIDKTRPDEVQVSIWRND